MSMERKYKTDKEIALEIDCHVKGMFITLSLCGVWSVELGLTYIALSARGFNFCLNYLVV